jgi:hypothetical protein
MKYFHTAQAYGFGGARGHCPVDHRYTQMLDIGDLVFFMTSKKYGVLVELKDGLKGYCIITLERERDCYREQFRFADISEISYASEKRTERRFLEVHSINARNRANFSQLRWSGEKQ